MNHRFLSIAIVVTVSVLSGLTLLGTLGIGHHPEFLQYEIDGHIGRMDLNDLCSPDLLAGLEGPLDNPADSRVTSIFYMFPQKLWSGPVDWKTFHRNLTVFYYTLALLGFGLLMLVLNFSWFATLLTLTYYAGSDKLVSGVTTPVLPTVSLVWLFGVLILFSLLESGRQNRFSVRMLTAALLGLWIPFAYECYTVVRPAAFLILVFCAVYLIVEKDMRRLLPAFLAGAGAGAGLIMLIHPGIRFDLSLFTGNGESIVAVSGDGIRSGALKHILNRIDELRFLFRAGEDRGFRYYVPPGFLEIWFPVGALCLYILMLNRGVLDRSRDWLETRRWSLALLALVLFCGMVTPLGSTRPVRAMRLFMVYPAALLVLGFLVTLIFSGRPVLLKMILAVILSVPVLLYFNQRLEVMRSWRPPEFDRVYHGTAPWRWKHIRQLVDELERTEPPRLKGEEFILEVCNASSIRRGFHFGNRRLAENMWKYALFTSGFYCRIPGEGRFYYDRNDEGSRCACPEGAACIPLEVQGEEVVLNFQEDPRHFRSAVAGQK